MYVIEIIYTQMILGQKAREWYAFILLKILHTQSKRNFIP